MIYYTTLTNVGEAKLANAFALGVPLPITHMAVGDGAGATPEPDKNQQQLINEVRRAPLNSLGPDALNPSALLAEQIIPAEAGGWWIRELGLFDRDGDLIAVSNCPPTYKPLLTEGSGRTQILRMLIAVSSIDSVELKVDPSVVLATREYVDNALMASSIAVSIEGPTTVYAGSSNHYKITNYHSFSSYEVATDSGEISINGENITLLLSDTDTASPARIRVIRDGQLNVFDITVMEKSIAQPIILTPVHESENINTPVIISATPYQTYPAGIGTHSKSHWKLTSDIFGNNIVWQSFDDQINLTQIQTDNSLISKNTTYYAHVRYYSSALGYSEWSLPSKFTTAEKLTYSIGQIIDGDIVGAIYNGNYLLIAPASKRENFNFSTENFLVGANSETDGIFNTNKFIARGIENYPAIQHYNNLGYYIPAIVELTEILKNREIIDQADPTAAGNPSKMLESPNTGGKWVSSTENGFVELKAIANIDLSSTYFQRLNPTVQAPIKRIPV